MILVFFLLFPVVLYYFSPYLVVMGAFEGIASGSLLLFGALFFCSLLLGRAFCGWVCPAGGLQEAYFAVSDKKARGGRYNWIKYLLWVPWIGLIIAGIITAGGLRSIEPLYQTTSGISVTESASYIILYLILTLITVLSFTAGRRAFCHYGCWMAPFMVIGVKIRNLLKWPALHLAPDRQKCKQCKRCTSVCPMSLPVDELVRRGNLYNSECILCGSCADICPEKSISFSFGSPERNRPDLLKEELLAKTPEAAWKRKGA